MSFRQSLTRTAGIAVAAAMVLTALSSTGRSFTIQAQKALVFTHGVACGSATETSVVLWTRTSAPTTLHVAVSDADSGGVLLDPANSAVLQTTADSDYTIKTTVDGLRPGTRLRYAFVGPNAERSPEGTCRTAIATGSADPVTFAFSGDADWKWRPYPLLQYLNREQLDFFFFLGDLIYETTNGDGTTAVEDLAGYRLKYRENRELPDAAIAAGQSAVPLRGLYGSFGQYQVFDNHETGPSKVDPKAPAYNDGGTAAGDGVHQFVNQTPGWQDRVRAFDEYNPSSPGVVTGTGDPRSDGTPKHYFTQPWGQNAELIVADDRSYRDARLKSSDDPEADNPARTMLGKPQLAWLEQQLSDAQATRVIWKFVVVSSPIDQLGRASEVGPDLDGTKSWAGGYRFERDTLLKYIADHGVNNVVFLTTDDHATRISELRYHATPGDPTSPLMRAGNAFQILSGPIGASTGLLAVKADTTGLSGHAIDAAVASVLVGDKPNTDGVTRGQKQAGLPPTGLPPDFPGLVESSIVVEGGPNGVAQPSDFLFFNTDGYAVITATADRLNVRTQGVDAFDFAKLDTPAGQIAYANEPLRQLVNFTVMAR